MLPPVGSPARDGDSGDVETFGEHLHEGGSQPSGGEELAGDLGLDVEAGANRTGLVTMTMTPGPGLQESAGGRDARLNPYLAGGCAGTANPLNVTQLSLQKVDAVPIRGMGTECPALIPVAVMRERRNTRRDLMMFTHKLKMATAAAALVVVAGSGIAYGFWSSGGTGAGTAASGTTATVTINQTSPAIVDLGPGVAPENLAGTFTATKPAYVNQVTPVVTSTSNVGCTAADFTITLPPATAAEVLITGTTWGPATIVFKDNPLVNQDACKGVTVNIGYTSN
jgi:hypothetical protein